MASNRFYKRRKVKKIKDRTNRNHKRLLIIIPAAVIVVAVLLIILLSGNKIVSTRKYLASSSSGVFYYYYNETENRLIRSAQKLPRGAAVEYLNTTYTEHGTEYAVIQYEGKTCYIDPSVMVDKPSDVITETEIWVRTNATVYEDEEGFRIASLAKKGDHLDITGFDEISRNGTISKYEVSFTDAAGKNVNGWIYSKYVCDSEEDALAVNTKTWETHMDRSYSIELYGGSPTSLDWFEVEKPSFSDNPLCKDASAMYITLAGVNNIDQYIELAKANKVNCLVIDIKNESQLAYPCDEIEDFCPAANEEAYYVNPSGYKAAIKKCRDAGLYCIGRICVFKDSVYYYEHPEYRIDSSVSSKNWCSAYSRDCWYYNITLARAVASDCGFNEIQFDYVRFPDEAYYISKSGDADFKNVYDEEKAQAVQGFCYYACDALHDLGVYVSIAVTAECSNAYVNASGLYYPAISLVVDAISAIPYTDGFDRATDTWSDPYRTLYDWASKAATRQREIPNPAVARTFITAYDVPSWDPTVKCDLSYVMNEVQALTDAGLSGGFIAWNEKASLDKYKEIQSVFGHTFTPENTES